VIAVPHAPQLETLDGFTVAAWIRLGEQPLLHRAVVTKTLGEGIENSWELFFDEEALFFGMFGEAEYHAVVLPGPFVVDQWMHLAGTWDEGSITLWVDGEAVGSVGAPTLEFDDHPILVGADDDHYVGGVLTGYFLGSIDDVRVYRRVLSIEELAVLASG
jgi:hypothetical protein